MKKILSFAALACPLIFAIIFAQYVVIDRLAPSVIALVIYILVFIEFDAWKSGAGVLSIFIISASISFILYDFGELVLILNTFALCIGSVVLLTHMILEDDFNGTKGAR
jgi:hypothetical protein